MGASSALVEEVWQGEPLGTGYPGLFLPPALALTPVSRVKMGSAPSSAVVEGKRGSCADEEMVGAGNLSGLRSCSSCLKIQIAANLSSGEKLRLVISVFFAL